MKPIIFFAGTWCVLSLLSSCHKHSIPYNQNGDWAAETQLEGPARSEAAVFVIGNFAYLGTGWDGLNTRYTDFWRYDPVNNVWLQVKSMPGTGRSSAFAMSVNGQGYVGTGYDGSHFLNDFYSYDPVLNEWTMKANFAGSSRYEAVAFGIGNFGYAGTGFDGVNALKDFYQYDPALDQWTDIGFSGNKRYGGVAFVYNDRGYLVTGVNGSQLQNDFWVFDPASTLSKWTELRHISNVSTDSYDDGYSTIGRSNASAFVEGGEAYISTGENNGLNSSTWKYDFASDLWSQVTPFEGPSTTGAVGFSLSGTTGGGGYIATGRNAPTQASASDFLWQFFPGLVQNPNDNQ